MLNHGLAICIDIGLGNGNGETGFGDEMMEEFNVIDVNAVPATSVDRTWDMARRLAVRDEAAMTGTLFTFRRHGGRVTVVDKRRPCRGGKGALAFG